jgi:hypothetical protein
MCPRFWKLSKSCLQGGAPREAEANQLLHLTGAAILVFPASTSHRRPRQVSVAFGDAE